MSSHKSKIIILSTILIVMVSLFAGATAGYAQESNGWTQPVNLSLSGLAADPVLMLDAKGTLHAIWMETVDNQKYDYKYSQSTDEGITWSAPQTASFPFDSKGPAPVFIFDSKGLIHILWQNAYGKLSYGEATTLGLLNSQAWLITRVLGSDVTRFHVTLDALGVMHLVYIQNANHDNRPAGVYYRRSAVGGGGWTEPVRLFESEYFRSSKLSETFIGIASSDSSSPNNVYVTWDNQPQKRVYMAVSQDGGVTWAPAQEMIGPTDTGGLDAPFNLNVAAAGDKVLLLWQLGEPGAEKCSVFSRSSENGGKDWGEAVSVMGGSTECPTSTSFVIQNEDQIVAQINGQGDPILTAWNGKEWSDPQSQNRLPTISNPVTLDNILLDCRFDLLHQDRLYVIGCDEGGGGDVWFLSRSLDPVENWFSLPSTWTDTVVLSDQLTKASALSMVPDASGLLHSVWAQSSLAEDGTESQAIEYAGWDGSQWTQPQPIMFPSGPAPSQMALAIHPQERLLLAWIDDTSGDLLFSWVKMDRANLPSEWAAPVSLPSLSDLISSPDMVVDQSGRIVVAYAISLNEARGIYIVQSSDGGSTWSQPVSVFDGVAAHWGKVGDPRLSLGADGILHLIFSRADLRPGQPVGLYYSRSLDGGASWSEPQTLSEGAIQWSDIASYDQQTVHVFWQEYDGLVYANMSQLSPDGGKTWSKPLEITGSNDLASPVSVALDGSGRVSFVQLLKNGNETTLSQESLILQDWEWSGTAWEFGSDRDLTITGKGIDYSLSAAVNSAGYLLVSVSSEISGPQDEIHYDIRTFSRFLGAPGGVQAPAAALLPTPNVVSGSTEVPTVIPTLPADLSELQNDNISPASAQRNTIGLVILGIVMIVTAFLLFRGRSSPVKK